MSLYRGWGETRGEGERERERGREGGRIDKTSFAHLRSTLDHTHSTNMLTNQKL